MILRLLLKQQNLFLVMVVECGHTVLFSVYLFKQMGAAFTDDHKIYVQQEISLMYSPVCDFSGSSTKRWICAHPWSCGHGYRLCVLCTAVLPVPKCTSGMARLWSQGQAAGAQGLCWLPQAVSACGAPEGGATRGFQVEVPDSCGSSATVACACLWGRASTDTSWGPAGSCVLVGGLCRQLLESPECSWELRDLQCFPGGLHESPKGSVGHGEWLLVVQCSGLHLYFTSVLNWELSWARAELSQGFSSVQRLQRRRNCENSVPLI